MPLRLSCTLREFVFFFNIIPPQESKNQLKKSGTLQPIRAASGPSSHCISPPSPFCDGLLWIPKSQRWCGRCQEIRETNKEISLIYFLFCKKSSFPPPGNKKHRHHFLSYFWKGRLFGAKLYTFLVGCCPNSDTKSSRWLWHNQSSHGSRLQFQRWCRRLGGRFDHLIFAQGFLGWLLKKMHRNVPRHIYLLRFFSCLVDIFFGVQSYPTSGGVWIGMSGFFGVQKNFTAQQNHGSGIPSFQETQGLAQKIQENGVFWSIGDILCTIPSVNYPPWN